MDDSYTEILSFDQDLKLSNVYIEEVFKKLTPPKRAKIQELKQIPSYPSTYVLAYLSSKVYEVKNEGENEVDYENRLKLPEGWQILTTASSEIVWLRNEYPVISSYYGVAFYNNKRQLVIAHRGSDPLNPEASRTDFYGVCHNYAPQVNSALNFTHKVYDALVAIAQQCYWQVFITGHCFGGWLAQIATFSLKYLKIDYSERKYFKNAHPELECHARTEVFNSIGCKETLLKITADFDIIFCDYQTPSNYLDITNYIIQPNMLNCCRIHTGQILRIFPEYESGYDVLTEMRAILHYFSPRTDNQCKNDTDSLNMKEVVLWPSIAYSFNDCPDEDFLNWAAGFKDFNLKSDDDTFTKVIDMENVKTHYKTRQCKRDSFSPNVFTQSQLDFLRLFLWLRQEPEFFQTVETNSKVESKGTMTERDANFISSQFQQLFVERTNIRYTGVMNRNRLIPFVKAVIDLFPDLAIEAKKHLSFFETHKIVYDKASKEYESRTTQLTHLFEENIWLDLVNFLDNENLNTCQIQANNNLDLVAARVVKTVRTLSTRVAFYSVFYMDTQNLINTNKHVKLEKMLRTEALGRTLFVLECNTNSDESKILIINLMNILRGKINLKFILVTEASNQIDQVVKLFGSTVLVGTFKHIEHDDIAWDALTTKAHTNLLKKQITFQGHSHRLSLENLLLGHQYSGELTELSVVKEVVDSATLVMLIRNQTVTIGKPLQSLGEIADYYVPRNIRMPYYRVENEFLERLSINDLVAISGFGFEEISAHWVKRENIRLFHETKNCKIVVINSKEDFVVLHQQNSSKDVHWLNHQSGKFFWKATLGSLRSIRKYAKEECFSLLSEDSFLDTGTSWKSVIISDTAGMGKSTVLHDLALKLKMKYPSYWIVRINLNDCSSVFKEALETFKRNSEVFGKNNSNEVIDFITDRILSSIDNAKLESYVEKRTFKEALKRGGRIVLFFDGFDEISPDYETLVIELLIALLNTRVEKVFVTTRPHTKEGLENKLGVFSFSMQPFTTDEQISFLLRFWRKYLSVEKINAVDLKIYAEESIKKLSLSINDTEREFMGVPLQCRLLADFMLDKIENSDHLFPRFYLFDLFQAFVVKKFNIFQLEKSSDTMGKTTAEAEKKLMKEQLRKLHCQYALRLTFSNELFEELQYPEIDEDLHEILETQILKAGLMLRTGESPQFVHKTFADFLVLDFMLIQAKNLRRNRVNLKILLIEILVQPEFGCIRSFMNSLQNSGKNTNEISGMIDLYLQHLIENWIGNNASCVARNEETVFHVLLNEYQKEILTILTERFKKISSFDIIKAFIGAKDYMGNTALHTAVKRENMDMVKFLIENGCDVNARSKGDDTPLFLATLRGHHDILAFLIANGARVNDLIGISSQTSALYIACRNGQRDIVTFLLENGANVNQKLVPRFESRMGSMGGFGDMCLGPGASVYVSSNFSSRKVNRRIGCSTIANQFDETLPHREDLSPLHIACQNGYLDIAKVLIQKGANVNARIEDHLTPLHVAARDNQLDIALLLIESGADLNARSVFGATPLHVASHMNHLGIVTLLVEKKADVNVVHFNNVPRKGNEAPLHWAAKAGNVDVIRILLDNGAKTHLKNIDGQTPLDLARYHHRANVVEILSQVESIFGKTT